MEGLVRWQEAEIGDKVDVMELLAVAEWHGTVDGLGWSSSQIDPGYTRIE